MQDSSAQLLAIRNAGYDITDNRVIDETVSGGVMAMTRPVFSSMVEHKLEAGDTLVVLKLKRSHSGQVRVICSEGAWL